MHINMAERSCQWDEVQHIRHARPSVFLASFTAVVAAGLRGEDDEAVRHVRIEAEAGPRAQLAELTVAAAVVDDERELLAGRVLRLPEEASDLQPVAQVGEAAALEPCICPVALKLFSAHEAL